MRKKSGKVAKSFRLIVLKVICDHIVPRKWCTHRILENYGTHIHLSKW